MRVNVRVLGDDNVLTLFDICTRKSLSSSCKQLLFGSISYLFVPVHILFYFFLNQLIACINFIERHEFAMNRRVRILVQFVSPPPT